jgi:hypothetical protein
VTDNRYLIKQSTAEYCQGGIPSSMLAFFAPALTLFAELQNNKPSVMHGRNIGGKPAL